MMPTSTARLTVVFLLLTLPLVQAARANGPRPETSELRLPRGARAAQAVQEHNWLPVTRLAPGQRSIHIHGARGSVAGGRIGHGRNIHSRPWQANRSSESRVGPRPRANST